MIKVSVKHYTLHFIGSICKFYECEEKSSCVRYYTLSLNMHHETETETWTDSNESLVRTEFKLDESHGSADLVCIDVHIFYTHFWHQHTTAAHQPTERCAIKYQCKKNYSIQ